MKLLDLFCGAGGCARGYTEAGFEVHGVDIKPQPRYLLSGAAALYQADALEFLAQYGHEYDAIHASPPCPRYANVTRWRGRQEDHPDLLPGTRILLSNTGKPWVIENVEGAPMRPDLILCGTMFDLRIRRHRWFEASGCIFGLQPSCDHRNIVPFEHKRERAFADAMGCDWMTGREARQAIPPAYTRWIGERLMEHLKAGRSTNES